MIKLFMKNKKKRFFFYHSCNHSLTYWSCITYFDKEYMPSTTAKFIVLSHFSHVQLCATLRLHPSKLLCPWGFSRHEYWSGLLCLPSVQPPAPGIEPVSLTSPALAGRLFTSRTTWEAIFITPRYMI